MKRKENEEKHATEIIITKNKACCFSATLAQIPTRTHAERQTPFERNVRSVLPSSSGVDSEGEGIMTETSETVLILFFLLCLPPS